MALDSYQFRSASYWLGFVFAGQAFTLSHRKVIPPQSTLFLQIATGKNKIAHITNRMIISGREQLGIKLIKSPEFVPGKKVIQAVNLDGRSNIKASTSFIAGASEVTGGTVLEESFIPMKGFGHGGTPVEAEHFERILKESTNYILAVTNEGTYPTHASISMAFYESEN